ncbi:Uncharacterized membrane protein YoaK, UPF0700 family [Colwellia chukchiensis]|uniref:Uncharacterized membrane protein YoaK, UPF0700 family n=1 Tax=Colwellia chukchiensis TaxID=641665 RepID=A0A1H7MQW2_9GAMM|nr:YoaK family protein [Colwellia chukchiensis]SEL12997.1 Uncharacterized membrane protein YoaK, UPF0700 family [Colwellia chukchiensis]
MITKLPRWVEYGAFILSLIAGLVNAVGLLGFKHQAISHLSGTATLLGTGLLNNNFSELIYFLLIIVSFILGAAMSGYFLRSGALKLGRNYSALLYLEMVFLIGASYFLMQGSANGIYLASAACGLQNAFASTYSGAIVRTTHLTGIFTDLGLMLGAKLRGQAFDERKALLLLLIMSGFIAGGTIGAYCYALFKFQALLIPAGICLLLAISYSIYSRKINSK